MSIAHPIIISSDWGLSQRLTWKEADISSIPALAGGAKKQSLGLVLARHGGRRRRHRSAAAAAAAAAVVAAATGEARLGLRFVEKAELTRVGLDSESRRAAVKSAGSGSETQTTQSSGELGTIVTANVKQEGAAEAEAEAEAEARVSGESGGCEACGNREMERGCNGEGRIMGGIGSVPGFGWWPIKAYRPCPSFLRSGGRYRRSGQSLDEIAFGRKGTNDDLDVSERLNTK